MSRTATEIARSCLFAGALGDAWGGPYEGGTPIGLAPLPSILRISDDTCLTLATCEAIVRARGRIVPEEIASSFASWYQAGRLVGVGSATLKALRDLSAGAHWALAGASGEAVTPDSAVCDRLLELQALREPSSAIAARFGSSGHVVDAVPLALYVARSANSSLETVLAEAAGLGGDTDTIAAIAGQIVGAGMDSRDLPWSRIHAIAEFAQMEERVDAFAKLLA